MAKSKRNNELVEIETPTPTAAVTARLTAATDQANNDWCELVAEAATLNIQPPPNVIDSLGRQTDRDQPRFRFRIAVESFRTAVAGVMATARATLRLAEFESTHGDNAALAAAVRDAENALADARRNLRKRDALAVGVAAARGTVTNALREHRNDFDLEMLETAAGQSLPTPPNRNPNNAR